MILLSMVIMNLSVAAVIEGLAEASKENTGVVSGDQIDFLIEKWKDYDNNASGLITYRSFLFLLYEVPPPLGIGAFKNYHSENTYAGDIPQRDDLDEDEERKGEIKNLNNLGLQDRYIIHTQKRIYIKKSDAIKIFNDYAVPLYEDKVHFKDVAKALVEKIFKKNKLSYDLTGKILNRLNKQWEGKYYNLKKVNAIKGIDTGVMEAGKAILKFYQRAKGNQEVSGLRRGKSMNNKSALLQQSEIKQSKKSELQEEVKLEENKIFSSKHIEKFIEKGDSYDVRQDKEYDAFRYLMNERLTFNYDKNPFMKSSRDNNNPGVTFTWFNDPNFKMNENESSSDDDKEDQLKFSHTLRPNQIKRSSRSPYMTRKSEGQMNLKQMNFLRKSGHSKSGSKLNIPSLRTDGLAPIAENNFFRRGAQLLDPSESKILERREKSKPTQNLSNNNTNSLMSVKDL